MQWVQLAVALYSLHLMASTEEWVRPSRLRACPPVSLIPNTLSPRSLTSIQVGLGDDDDDLAYHQQQQQHHSSSGNHSIADYNHHPAPSSAVSIQKTKRLDRRALAYVRGRKLR